jgi:hypothetical protein
MITEKEIQDYGFEDINDYFDYIVDSRMNGQHKQARNLYNALSDGQKETLFYYYEYVYFYEASSMDEEENYVEEFKNYLNNKPKKNYE